MAKEVVQQLRVTDKTARNWIPKNELAAFDLGHSYRIKRQNFDSFLHDCYRGMSSFGYIAVQKKSQGESVHISWCASACVRG